ncbi:MAG: 16S rRNA (guanine(527)-N(7))-methyltransferase RsmG [Xanthomonadales bacterium]
MKSTDNSGHSRNMRAKQLLSAGLNTLFAEEPESGHVDLLLSYLELLVQWNASYNLTAVRDPLEMVSRHLLDSLTVLPWVHGEHLLDAGTGAGLPGIPLAIVRPELSATLLDSTGKKIRFLRHVKRRLKLENIQLVQERLESWQAEAKPTCIISRAFSKLAGFVEASRHLAARDTMLLAMKGKYPETELEALPDWTEVHSVEKLHVPGLQEDRHLVIMSVNKFS